MSIYLIWFLIGIGFFVSELASPAFILFFFGLGAWVTSLAMGIFPDLTFNQQIVIFSSSSIALLLLLRNYVKNIYVGQQNEGEDKYFHKISKGGSSGVVTQTIKPGGFGEIKFKGTFYKAKSEEAEVEIKSGENVTVIKQGDDQGSFLVVKKLN